MKTKSYLKVLIGDDSSQIRNTLARQLMVMGLESDLRATAEEIIGAAKKENYLAIITDLEYTSNGEEGYRILEETRELPTTRILYTGRRGFETFVEALGHGADYVVLRKDLAELLEIIEEIKGGEENEWRNNRAKFAKNKWF